MLRRPKRRPWWGPLPLKGPGSKSSVSPYHVYLNLLLYNIQAFGAGGSELTGTEKQRPQSQGVSLPRPGVLYMKSIIGSLGSGAYAMLHGGHVGVVFYSHSGFHRIRKGLLHKPQKVKS